MGKICSDDLFFFFTNSIYLDIVCYVAIFLCLILLFMLQYKSFFKKRFRKFKLTLFILIPSLFILFFGGTAFSFLNKERFNGCMNSYNFVHTDSKIIISGDSRMEYIVDDDKIVLPYNVSFVAKSGASIQWFSSTAMPELRSTIENVDDEFNYYVIVNMGVNDVQENLNINNRVDDYFKYYKELAKINRDVKIYIMSVNPIIEDKLNKIQPQNNRTNEKIEQFNNRIKEDLIEEWTDNMYYCDAYNDLEFDTDDGLHYTRETNKKIIKYITDDCIKY